MKILSIGNFSGPSWDGSQPDEEHIAKALEDLGHEVIRWQRDDLNLDYGGTVPWFEEGEPDFTLIAQWDGYDRIKTKDVLTGSFIKELPKPLVYWTFDYQADGQEWHEKLIEQSDLYLSKRIADSKYPNWQYLSQDFAPDFLGKTTVETNTDIQVLFTGSYLPWATERNKTLEMVDKTFNLVIHSVNEWPGFKDVRPPIMDEGLPELYARAQVILSIDHTLETGYHSDRNAQIMFCYKRPLFRYIPMSELVFKDKVDYFYDIKDCLDKIQEKLSSKTTPYYTDRDMTYIWDTFSVKSRVRDLLTIVGAIL